MKTPAITLAVLALAAPTLGGGPPPDYGFNFITIGDPGNPAYPGSAPPLVGMSPTARAGRGSVAYEYRIAETEVTTTQWIEFLNTFTTRNIPGLPIRPPTFWGGRFDPNYPGPGRRYIVNDDLPGAERISAHGISWYDAARFVNWLHNGKSSDPASLESGVYDSSTWILNKDFTRQDQLTRSPGAKYWIPSLDEWLKAAHYDPSKNGTGDPGWWRFSHTSDEPPVPGLPGAGQSAGPLPAFFGGMDVRYLPLGSYPDVRSPWGLLDTSGGAAEWTEEAFFPGQLSLRGVEESWSGAGQGLYFIDWAGEGGARFPNVGGNEGLRVASLVPGASTCMAGAIMCLRFCTRSRRR